MKNNAGQKGVKRVAITDFFHKRQKTDPDYSSTPQNVPYDGDRVSVGKEHGKGNTCSTHPSTEKSSSSRASSECPSRQNDASHSVGTDLNAVSVPQCTSAAPPTQRQETASAMDLDIGAHAGNAKKLTDYEKSRLLQAPWTPDANYKYPTSQHNKCGKVVNRRPGPQHLAANHWLALSDIGKGLYCKYCVLFAPDHVGRRSRDIPGVLVTRPLTSFAKLCGKDGALTHHANSEYHKDSVTLGKNFLLTYHSPALEVANQVNAQRLAQVQENRARLRPIVETVIFCGRQNVPLKVHRDDGALSSPNPNATSTTGVTDKSAASSSVVSNDGNFRALLRFRVSAGDTTLADHLKTSGANATYISKTTQNALIDCCGQNIKEPIAKRVQEAGCYSVIFDETTDLSRKEQMSVSVRYLSGRSIREDFIGFTDCYQAIEEDHDTEEGEVRLTGEALGNIALKVLTSNNIDVKKCVGTGTDNCMVMASEAKGAAAEIQKQAPMAIRCPCLNHSLNSSLKKSLTSVNACRCAVSKMKETIGFSASSAKIFRVFSSCLGRALSSLSETRWLEIHDGVLNFKDDLPKICDALRKITHWISPDTSSTAQSLLNGLCWGEFIIATHVLSEVLAATRSLSLKLQSPSLDYAGASDAVKDVVAVLERKRKFSENGFRVVYGEALKTAEEMDVEIKTPRAPKRQTKRDNHPAENPEEYYRRSVYIPVIDHVLSELRDRFSEEVLGCFNLRLLLPSSMELSRQDDGVLKEDTIKKLNSLAEFYGDLIHSSSSLLIAEYELWRERWRRLYQEERQIPTAVLDTIDACDEDLFPSILQLLRVLATLPVSVATGERSFSSLRRIKTWQLR